jgi:hypothetical protein
MFLTGRHLDARRPAGSGRCCCSGSLRRSELVALDIEDLKFDAARPEGRGPQV